MTDYSKSPKFEESIKDYYSSICGEYDRLYNVPDNISYEVRQSIQEDLNKIKENLAGLSVVHWCDLGCGTSYWTRYIKSISNISIYDCSTKMLKASAERLSVSHPGVPVRSYIADFMETTIDISADTTIFMGFVLSHYPDEIILSLLKMIRKNRHNKIVVIDSAYGKHRRKKFLQECYKNISPMHGVAASVYKRYFSRECWVNLLNTSGFAESSERSYWGDAYFISNINAV